MKFEQAINKHLRLLKEQEEEELAPVDPAAAPVDPAMAADPAAAPMDPAMDPAEPPPPEPEEAPAVDDMRVASVENLRKALLMDRSELTDHDIAGLSAGEVTATNVDEKEKLFQDILGGNPGDVEVGGLEGRPGIA
jgi:hypothetical protein